MRKLRPWHRKKGITADPAVIPSKTDIEVGPLLRTIDYDYPTFHLTMHCFKCKLAGSHITLLEHEAAKWLAPSELLSVNWLPADEEIIEELKKHD